MTRRAIGRNTPREVLEVTLEADLDETVRLMAKDFGYRHYHTHDSQHSTKGFPDWILTHDGFDRFLVVENKRYGARVTDDQIPWLDFFATQGVETYVWDPTMHLDIEDLMGGVALDSWPPHDSHWFLSREKWIGPRRVKKWPESYRFQKAKQDACGRFAIPESSIIRREA